MYVRAWVCVCECECGWGRAKGGCPLIRGVTCWSGRGVFVLNEMGEDRGREGGA